MKTTLVLDDALVEQVRQQAKERGVSMSSIVEEAIFRMLTEKATPDHPPLDLPSFNSGGHLVDIADRNAMYDALDDPTEMARPRGEQ
jgi:hypothetical protein